MNDILRVYPMSKGSFNASEGKFDPKDYEISGFCVESVTGKLSWSKANPLKKIVKGE